MWHAGFTELEDIRNTVMGAVSMPQGTKKIDYIKRLITERDGYLQDKDMVIDFVRNTIGRIIGVKFMPGLEASLISLEVEFNRLKTKFKKEKIIWIFITLLILQLLI